MILSETGYYWFCGYVCFKYFQQFVRCELCFVSPLAEEEMLGISSSGTPLSSFYPPLYFLGTSVCLVYFSVTCSYVCSGGAWINFLCFFGCTSLCRVNVGSHSNELT
ncbi:uncharacterized protein A4U43_C03F32290 [Asparagus officinalis]|uniref:Uncharacterized protein n=1 Tax=Asparagus officinalis TaxID=4686 RepID=A0A5P1FIS2_ASPOF|nr:uncharacterized protein A4U43_C03F32290 [Asparagus officinalis]